MAERKSRRRFLAEGALALAGVAAARPDEARAAPDAGTGATPAGPAPASSSAVTPDDFAHAERIERVAMTPPQRVMAAESWELNIGPYFARRDFPLGDESPAMVWNPVLRGTGRMPKKNRVVRSSWTPRKSPGDEELAFAPVHVLSRWVQARQVSSVRLTELALARLERYQPQLNCTITLIREQALAEAEAADREISHGRYRGPLHGIPYGAKDLLDTAGIRTTWGAEPFRNRVPREDATVIARLRAAGAVLVAKLSLGALALNDVWFGGRTSNPWFLEEGSGGSSAGSAAAVSAGLVPFALGSETFGSTVGPCTRCGLTGLRPTFGRVPRTGAMTLSWSHDKLSAMTRSVEDAALVLAAISGADPKDLSSQPSRFEFDATRGVKGMKIGFVPAWLERGEASSLVSEAMKALERLGARRVDLTFPPLPWAALFTLVSADAAASFERLTLSGEDAQLRMQVRDAWPNVFRQARFVSAVDYVQADRFRRVAAKVWAEQLSRVDLVLAPSLVDGAPASALLDEPASTNSTGHPCLVLPAGFVSVDRIRSDWLPPPGQQHPPVSPPRKMPSSVSLIGHLWDEGTLCTAGLALERALGMSDQHPPGFG
ncbi:MAG TPA: amidase [Myxococcaceae bacterium]|nr:amidase [Myxococcaceae bacterium]